MLPKPAYPFYHLLNDRYRLIADIQQRNANDIIRPKTAIDLVTANIHHYCLLDWTASHCARVSPSPTRRRCPVGFSPRDMKYNGDGLTEPGMRENPVRLDHLWPWMASWPGSTACSQIRMELLAYRI